TASTPGPRISSTTQRGRRWKTDASSRSRTRKSASALAIGCRSSSASLAPRVSRKAECAHARSGRPSTPPDASHISSAALDPCPHDAGAVEKGAVVIARAGVTVSDTTVSANVTERTDAEPATPVLTIVVPTFNECDNVQPLVDRLDRTLANERWEVIFVDDDSTDGTPQVVREMARRDPRVRMIHRIWRRGLASAVVEGVQSSTAPFVAVMDADLQHDESIL